MTAQLSFEVDSVTDVIKVPNAALRFYPENIQLVREQDRKLLDGSQWNRGGDQSGDTGNRDPDEDSMGSDTKKEKSSDTSENKQTEKKETTQVQLVLNNLRRTNDMFGCSRIISCKRLKLKSVCREPL